MRIFNMRVIKALAPLNKAIFWRSLLKISQEIVATTVDLEIIYLIPVSKLR